MPENYPKPPKNQFLQKKEYKLSANKVGTLLVPSENVTSKLGKEEEGKAISEVEHRQEQEEDANLMKSAESEKEIANPESQQSQEEECRRKKTDDAQAEEINGQEAKFEASTSSSSQMNDHEVMESKAHIVLKSKTQETDSISGESLECSAQEEMSSRSVSLEGGRSDTLKNEDEQDDGFIRSPSHDVSVASSSSGSYSVTTDNNGKVNKVGSKIQTEGQEDLEKIAAMVSMGSHEVEVEQGEYDDKSQITTGLTVIVADQSRMRLKKELKLDLSEKQTEQQENLSTGKEVEVTSENNMIWQRVPMGTGDVMKKKKVFEEQIKQQTPSPNSSSG